MIFSDDELSVIAVVLNEYRAHSCYNGYEDEVDKLIDKIDLHFAKKRIKGKKLKKSVDKYKYGDLLISDHSVYFFNRMVSEDFAEIEDAFNEDEKMIVHLSEVRLASKRVCKLHDDVVENKLDYDDFMILVKEELK